MTSGEGPQRSLWRVCAPASPRLVEGHITEYALQESVVTWSGEEEDHIGRQNAEFFPDDVKPVILPLKVGLRRKSFGVGNSNLHDVVPGKGGRGVNARECLLVRVHGFGEEAARPQILERDAAR